MLAPLDLSITDAAAALGVTRKTLSALVNERQGVSPEMALRLGKAFATTAELWTGLQERHDLWRARQAVDLSGVRVLQES